LRIWNFLVFRKQRSDSLFSFKEKSTIIWKLSSWWLFSFDILTLWLSEESIHPYPVDSIPLVSDNKTRSSIYACLFTYSAHFTNINRFHESFEQKCPESEDQETAWIHDFVEQDVHWSVNVMIDFSTHETIVFPSNSLRFILIHSLNGMKPRSLENNFMFKLARCWCGSYQDMNWMVKV